jgi:hypothetical protein
MVERSLHHPKVKGLGPLTTSSCGSTVVEHSYPCLKVKALSPTERKCLKTFTVLDLKNRQQSEYADA